MNLNKNISKKYLVVIIIAPFILFLIGLSVEKLIKFNGTCYDSYGWPISGGHSYGCSIFEYIRKDVFSRALDYAIMGLPFYFMFFIIPISVIFLIFYIYRKIRAKS